jgi:hypothetical protein
MARFTIVTIAPRAYEHIRAFDEIKLLLYESLLELGHTVAIATNEFEPSTINIIFGCHLMREEAYEEIPADSIIFNTEQIGGDFSEWTQAILTLSRRHRIWDYSTHNIAALKCLADATEETGRIQRLRLGYHQRLERIRRQAQPDNDDGFAFIGSITKKREDILAKIMLSESLYLHGYFGFYGLARDAILNRSRAVLNIHSHSVRILEWTRILYLIANRVPVIALLHESTLSDDDQLSYVLPCSEEDPTPQLQIYYANPQELEQHAETAYARFSQLNQKPYTEQALDQVFPEQFYPSLPPRSERTRDHWSYCPQQRSPDPVWYRYTYPWLDADPRPLEQLHWNVGVYRQCHPDPQFAREIFKEPLQLGPAAQGRPSEAVSPVAPAQRLAVVLHFFSELRVTSFFINYGRHLPAGTDFYITASTRIVRALIEKVAADCNIGNLHIELIENIGRDIPSKYIVFNDRLAAYDLCFFSHGKESDANWFYDHNQLLAGSATRVDQITQLFAKDPTLGLVYPDYLAPLLPAIGWSSMRPMIDELLARFGCDTAPVSVLEFPAGGFFWARPQALTILHSLGLTLADLPAEPLPKDNTLLHALERMPCLSTEMMGMRWEKVGRT